MLVITQNAENAFLEALKRCAQQSESWRCLIFRLSGHKPAQDSWFRDMLIRVEANFGTGGEAFLFDDGDVSVLVRHATARSFSSLQAQVSALLAPLVMERVSSLHEVRIDLQALKDFIALKLNPSAMEERRAAPPVPDDPKTESYRLDLARTLRARRDKRNMPGIMIVEDDPFSLRLVSKVLEFKFALYTAQDGQSAIDTYLLSAPDMLFLDIGLPDVSGLELIDRIFGYDPDAYIVMLSGNGSRDNVLKAVENGAKGFVTKPFAREKLFHYIGKCQSVQQKSARV